MGVSSLHKERIREGANPAWHALLGDAETSRHNNQLDKDGCHSSRWPGCTVWGEEVGEKMARAAGRPSPGPAVPDEAVGPTGVVPHSVFCVAGAFAGRLPTRSPAL